MPQKRFSKRGGRGKPRRSFTSAAIPSDRNRRSPTWPAMMAPSRTALLRPPLQPASMRLNGMLYSEPALGFTAPTSGNAVTYFFSANGMFDPNITGTGHQPIGFDQQMLLYEQATVLRSCIEVIFNVGPGLTVICGVALFPDASGITDPKDLLENGLIKYIPITSGSSTFQNQRMQTTVRLDCDVSRYFGRPSHQSLLNDDNLYTTAAANPVEQVYFGIVAWQISPDGSTTTSIGFTAQLSYDAVFWEPRKLAIS